MAQLQGEQAAEGVPRDVRALDAQRLAQRTEYGNDRRQVVGEPVGQRGRPAETGEVHGDHVTFGGQRGHHGLPRLPVMSYPVQEQERFAGARPFVCDGQCVAARGGLDAEGDLCGHAAAPWGGVALDNVSATITAG